MPLLFDTLESRQLFAVAPPTPAEQYLIELINRARQDPTGTAAAIGVPLNEGLAANTIAAGTRQPLAVNGFLTEAAQFHAAFLRAAAQVSLVGLNGSTPLARITGSGYPAGGTIQSSAENVIGEFGLAGTGGGTGTLALTRAVVDAVFRNMFVDAATNGPDEPDQPVQRQLPRDRGRAGVRVVRQHPGHPGRRERPDRRGRRRRLRPGHRQRPGRHLHDRRRVPRHRQRPGLLARRGPRERHDQRPAAPATTWCSPRPRSGRAGTPCGSRSARTT
jgi:hypothetical protein